MGFLGSHSTSKNVEKSMEKMGKTTPDVFHQIGHFLYLSSAIVDSWSQDVLAMYEHELPKIHAMVKKYVKTARIPEIYILDNEKGDDFKKHLGISLYAKAATVGDRIFLFFRSHERRWKTILAHELYHAAIYENCQSNIEVVPYWLNEGVAYALGERSTVVTEELLEIFQHSWERVQETIALNPREIRTAKHGTTYSWLLGAYVVRMFSPGDIKEVIQYLTRGMSIAGAIEYVIAVTYDEFLENWRQSEIVAGKELIQKRKSNV